MKKILGFVLVGIFSNLAFAYLQIERGTPLDTTYTNCRLGYQTSVSNQKLVISPLCNPVPWVSVTLKNDVVQKAGYTLGELQKLILDYSRDSNRQIALKIVETRDDVTDIVIKTDIAP